MTDGDVFTVLSWGLRRYAWVVGACVLAFGVLVPAAFDRAPVDYRAEAQVGPSGPMKITNLDPLARIGQTVFNNGKVAESVRTSVDPPLSADTRVIPDRVELVAAQDNVVFVVVGHGSNGRSAKQVANIAAAAFAQELNKYASSIGAFAIQHLATQPVRPEPRLGGATAVGIGLLAGFITGVGLVALMLVIRRPVVDVGSAEMTTGSPVYARLVIGGPAGGIRGLPQLCRRILASDTDMLLLAGGRDSRRLRRLIRTELARVFGWSRTVLSADPDENVNRSLAKPATDAAGAAPVLVIIDAPSQLEVATRPETSVVLLVVREGMPRETLRRRAEQYLDDGPAGVVLVRSPGWHLLRRRRSSSFPGRLGDRPTEDDRPLVGPVRD